jgi:hypothetical protein
MKGIYKHWEHSYNSRLVSRNTAKTNAIFKKGRVKAERRELKRETQGEVDQEVDNEYQDFLELMEEEAGWYDDQPMRAVTLTENDVIYHHSPYLGEEFYPENHW